MLPGSYTTNVAITGKTVWLDGADATLNASTTANALKVSDGAHVRVTGLQIVDVNSDINGLAIRCEVVTTGSATPILELDRVSVDSANTALYAYPCSVSATRSTFHVRPTSTANIYALPPSTISIDRCIVDGGDGIQSVNQGTSVSVSNSLVRNMNGTNGAMIGRSFTPIGTPPPPGRLSASFVTLANAPLICSTGTPVCLGGSAAGACVDNSIVTTTTGDSVSGSACVLNYSLAFPQVGALTGAHNRTNVDPLFADAAASNFKLSASSPAIDAADPAANNSADLDGTPRPQGLRDDLGAYEFHP